MDTWRRRIGYYVLVLAAAILGFAVVYDTGMTVLEDEPVDFLHSLQVVVETFTATGYGSDSPWESPAMNVLVIVMNVTGVTLIFLTLPVLIVPLLEDALSATVPTSADDDLSDHVVVCTFNARSSVLVEELRSRDVDYVVVEPDRERAADVFEQDYEVIHADPDTVDGLRRANVTDARAVVADVSDQVDASIVLTAKELGEDVRVVSVVEEPEMADYHELAGADVVLSPRPLLGGSLAAKVTAGVGEVTDAVEVGEDFDVVELPVHRESDLVGQTIAESRLRERTGVNVIGAWLRGQFQSPPEPSATVDGSTVLLVTGRAEQIDRLRELARSEVRSHDRGESIVVGYGEVGRNVAARFDEAGVPYTTVDLVDRAGVDVVGDATDPELLDRVGVTDARSVVLALPDDTAAEFATLVVRDLNPTVEVIARVEQPEAVAKMYRAGADYVLSLASVTGRLTAAAVLDDEDVLSTDTQVSVVRVRAPSLAGQTLAEADVRARTGCTVVGVERDGEVVTDLGPDFRVREGDELVIAGTDEATNRFREQIG